MALGNNNSNDNNTLIFLKSVGAKKAVDFNGKDGVPYFEVSKKIEGEWKSVAKVDRFSGKIRSVKVGLRFDPNNKKHEKLIEEYGNDTSIKVEVEDAAANEVYVWKTGLTVASRGLFNRMFSLDNLENVEVSFWKNQAGFDTFSLRQNGEVVKWKYDNKDCPPTKKVKVKGKEITDTEDLDAFFVEKIEEHFKQATKEEAADSEDEGEAKGPF
jgi:hypothetical protein